MLHTARIFGLVSIGVAVVAGGCVEPLREVPQPHVLTNRPRNIILVIGDGMGPQQLALADIYYQRTGDKKAAALARFVRSSVHGMHTSLPDRSIVNDSACSASQLAGGCACEPRHVGVDVRGQRCPSIALRAHDRGMKVGLVSDTRITHATPAAFAAMVPDRDMEHQIATQLVESKLDLLLSGGEAFFVPSAAQCRGTRCADPMFSKYFRQDKRDLLSEASLQGVQVVSSARALEQCKHTPVLGLFAPSLMNDAFREAMDGEPSLAAMTERALELLEGSHGFFLMVEAGQIDMAAHVNDAGWVLQEMLRLSETLAVIERFAGDRDDTLVLVTADHETGGMGLSYRQTQKRGSSPEALDFLTQDVFAGLREQKQTIASAIRGCTWSESDLQSGCQLGARVKEATGVMLPDQVLRALQGRVRGDGQDWTGDDRAFYPYQNFVPAAMVGRAVGAARGVVWATGTHTTAPVSVMAKGAGQERFAGWQHARDVGLKLLGLLVDGAATP